MKSCKHLGVQRKTCCNRPPLPIHQCNFPEAQRKDCIETEEDFLNTRRKHFQTSSLEAFYKSLECCELCLDYTPVQ